MKSVRDVMQAGGCCKATVHRYAQDLPAGELVGNSFVFTDEEFERVVQAILRTKEHPGARRDGTPRRRSIVVSRD